MSGSSSDSECNSDVLMLLSGGLDSAACLKFYLDLGRTVTTMFVDYQQPTAEMEYAASTFISKFFGVELITISCNGMASKEPGLINARNAFLLSLALMEAPASVSSIALGVHSGTNYKDCSTGFIQKMQDIFDIYAENGQKKIHIAAPFIEWNKHEIWMFAKNNDVPVDATYSCERGGKMPCGECLSCLDMEALKRYA